MSTIVVDKDSVTIPDWVTSLRSFRRWARSPEFPETGRICYVAGDVWVDMSKEQLFSHNQVKVEFGRVLATLARERRKGRFFGDGALLSNEAANLSTQPDGLYVRFTTLAAGRVRMIEGIQAGFVELEGSPDMVLEVVSDSSENKDLIQLREQYWRAEVAEYWIVDARNSPVEFQVLRRGPRGYSAVRKQEGWQRSTMLGLSFRLLEQTDAAGNPDYVLQTR